MSGPEGESNYLIMGAVMYLARTIPRPIPENQQDAKGNNNGDEAVADAAGTGGDGGPFSIQLDCGIHLLIIHFPNGGSGVIKTILGDAYNEIPDYRQIVDDLAVRVAIIGQTDAVFQMKKAPDGEMSCQERPLVAAGSPPVRISLHDFPGRAEASVENNTPEEEEEAPTRSVTFSCSSVSTQHFMVHNHVFTVE